MAAYYNEIDPFAAQWIRNLMAAGHIAQGDVDERSIEDVKPSDLSGYTQCHFFAGIGVWSYALRQAGWPDDQPVWTGSCPCQPFSAAGKGTGFADERHLWPAFHCLIKECKPDVVFGEQVASKDGLAWLNLVQADLEGTGYAVGAIDTCAASVGAPHIRQRLYWVADTDNSELEGWFTVRQRATEFVAWAGCMAGGMADSEGKRPGLFDTENQWQTDAQGHFSANSSNSKFDRSCWKRFAAIPTGPTNGYWRDADWLACRDGKWRPVESGTFTLVDGASSRLGRLRAYGNAIVAPLATEFIKSYLECQP